MLYIGDCLLEFEVLLLYSQMTAYAIEALAFFAGLEKGTTVKAGVLSKILSIPPEYLGKVLTMLARKKYLASSKGPTGGFSLAVNPNKVSLYRLMASLDSLTPLEEHCVMGLQFCSSESPCAFHKQWSAFKEKALADAHRITLADIAPILLRKLRVHHRNERLDFTGLLEKS